MSQLLLGSWIALLVGCTKPDPESNPGKTFPEAFKWGSATSGFQVEPGCPTWSDEVCVDTQSDWYAWVTSPEIIDSMPVTGEDVRHSPGMWETFEDDVQLMQQDGHTLYRLSIEWSRIFPDDASAATSVDELEPYANSAAILRYHEFFAALDAAGIEPLVTINHNTLPLWVHDGVGCHFDYENCTARGWADPATAYRIALYAGFVGREFGAEVDQWATLNEPFANLLSGYVQPGEDRAGPPGLTLAAEPGVAVIRNQIEAHAAMYDQLKTEDLSDVDEDGAAANVGIVLNMVAIDPKNPDRPEDDDAVAHADHLYHRLFLDGLTDGAWDEDIDGDFDTTRDDLADRLDWIGINYYNRMLVSSIAPFQPFGDLAPAFDFLPEFTWESYEEGIGRVVERASVYGLPIFITENGTPNTEDAEPILEGHLESLWQAIDAGADVRGYAYWSFVDNYEWSHGLDMRFGLYELDIATKARTPRPVAERYREIIAAHGLGPE